MKTRSAGTGDLQIASKIRYLRLHAGMSQSALAEKLGITFQQIQKYEKGINRVGAGRLFEMARVFGVPVHAFFPDAEEFAAVDWDRSAEQRALYGFACSTEGLKLCERYLQLTPRLQQAVMALLKEMGGES